MYNENIIYLYQVNYLDRVVCMYERWDKDKVIWRTATQMSL